MQKTELKVACINVWVGGLLMKNLINFIQEQDHDILLLQEVFDDPDSDFEPQYRTFSYFQEILNYPHSLLAPAFQENQGGHLFTQGNAIFSRYPLQAQETTFYDQPFGVRENNRQGYEYSPRNLQHATTDINGTQLHLFNTQGIWGQHGGDTDRRIAMADHILAQTENLSPVLLAGDFNVKLNTQTIDKIEERLRSIFKDQNQTTFNLKRKDLEKYPGFADSVVDMIFVSPEIEILEHSTPEVDISDHLPLIATLKI